MECVQRKVSRGMTLVELLISLALSSMLSIMMINAFLLTKRTVLTQQALVRLQVNARTLDYLLGKALRNSGVFGCHKLQPYSVIVVDNDIRISDYGLLNTKGILGLLPYQLPADFSGSERILKRYKKDSDLLWVQSGNRILNNARNKNGSILAISDCQKISFFRQQDKKFPSVITPDTLSVLHSTIYYVGGTQRKNSRGRQIYALYSTDLNGRTLELVEGVEKIEVLYGSFIEGALVYQKTHQVSNWYAIVSVKMNALLNTIEDTDPIITKWWHYEWPLM